MNVTELIPIVTPLIIGIILNLIIYLVLTKVDKTKDVSIKITWYAAIAMLIFSYLLGLISSVAWSGFVSFIIALGMFTIAFVLKIIKNPIWRTSKEHK